LWFVPHLITTSCVLGITYEGNFQEGSFDGAGTMFFPKNESGGGGGRFVAKWKNGKLVKGTYFFEDDLEYRNKDWQYCTNADRRFWTEIQHGIQIADQPQLKNNVYVRVCFFRVPLSARRFPCLPSALFL
jgi:hypothetical protein